MKSDIREVTKISWDYMFMKETNKKDGFRPDVVEGEGLPIVAYKDSESKAAIAFAVPRKGDCEYAITRAAQDMNRRFGYKKAIFKSDQEPAIKSILDGVSALRGIKS